MEKLNWNTEYDNQKRTLTHIFSDRITAITHFSNNVCKVYKDGVLNVEREAPTVVCKYIFMLESISADAKKLQEFE